MTWQGCLVMVLTVSGVTRTSWAAGNARAGPNGAPADDGTTWPMSRFHAARLPLGLGLIGSLLSHR